MTAAELGEDKLLRRIMRSLPKHRDVIAAAGDDCAVMKALPKGRLLVLKTDCVVEHIHFATDAPAAAVGWKAMARPISDFAAMSAVPRFALVTLVIARATDEKWIRDVYRGLNKAARRFDVAIVGGETSSTRGPAAISVSICGEVEKRRWVSRSGGKPGDALFVTGRLGGSIAERHLRFVPRVSESRWLTENFHIHAMMDLSDGLGADLPRLARASGTGFEIDEKLLPLPAGCTVANAVSDGEDYELLFAIAESDSAALLKKWRTRFPRLLLTRIGCLNQKSKVRNQKFPLGYVHFTERK